MDRRPFLLVSMAVLAACASVGPGSVAPRPPAPLAYRVPNPPVSDYLVGDTAQVDLRAGGQEFPLRLSAASHWRMEFAPAERDQVKVTATLTQLAARISNPMTPDQTADASSVTGAVVFTLDGQGNSTIVSLPTAAAPTAAQFVSGAGIAYSFFPALPARAVAPGDTWSDTLSYTDDGGAGTKVRSIVSYTVVGDTVVGNGRYLLVRNTGTSEQATSGEVSGTDFSQTVAGTTRGHFLWDTRLGVLHSLEYHSDLSGTMMLEIVPVPMDVHVIGLLRVERVPSVSP